MPTVLDRMTAALADLETRWNGRRRPKAFYLGPADWADFMATNPPTIDTVWGNNPPKERTEPAFRDVPVRHSDKAPPRQSRLYDSAASGRMIPRDPNEPRPPRPAEAVSDIPADEVFAALDAISRTRALTDFESEALEAAMKGRVTLTKREAARLGIKRKVLA